MPPSAEGLKTDQAMAERAKAIAWFGLTERQARFLAPVKVQGRTIAIRASDVTTGHRGSGASASAESAGGVSKTVVRCRSPR